MQNLARNFTYAFSVASPLMIALSAGLDALGAADIACGVRGASPDICSSEAILLWFASPPSWFLALALLIGLVLFAIAERSREKVNIEKLDKLHRDFWQKDADRLANHDGIAAQFEKVEAAITSLDEALATLKSQTDWYPKFLIETHKKEVDVATGELGNRIELLELNVRSDLSNLSTEIDELKAKVNL